jgi:hypothetical protein
MLAANVTRTPDVPLPAIPELATAAEIRNASLVGHRIIAAAPEVRRLSTVFPTVTTASADPGFHGSSLADHMIADNPGPPRQGAEPRDRGAD